MKRKPKLSRIALEALRKAGIEKSWTEVGGPGEFSRDMVSWIEEQNIINRAIAASLRQNRDGRTTVRDRKIWREFKRRRPDYKGSDIALTKEIGRKYGLKKSAAFEARKRGEREEEEAKPEARSFGDIKAINPMLQAIKKSSG